MHHNSYDFLYDVFIKITEFVFKKTLTVYIKIMPIGQVPQKKTEKNKQKQTQNEKNAESEHKEGKR